MPARQRASEPPLRAELFTIEQLSAHAKFIAEQHKLGIKEGTNRLLAKLDANGNVVWQTLLDIEDEVWGGGYDDSAADVAIQNDGKIVVAGTQAGVGFGFDQFAIARFNANGTGRMPRSAVRAPTAMPRNLSRPCQRRLRSR